MKTYDQAKQDYLYLDSVYPGGDMVEIDADVFELMANPTKRRARKMYESAIQFWFDAVGGCRHESVPTWVLDDPNVIEIGQRYVRDYANQLRQKAQEQQS